MTRATGDLLNFFGASSAAGTEPRENWNVAPTTDIRVVTADPDEGDGARRLATARWGLVPSWAKDVKIGARMINARSETVLEKPSFRSAAVKRRALIPADGYYEWQKTADGKIPTYLHNGDAVLAFAALYEFWPDPDLAEDDEHKWLMSATILTAPAADALGHIHDRTPVIVPAGMFGDWLDPEITSKDEVRQLLDAIPEPTLTPRVVSDRVNSVRNNGPELLAEL